MPRSVAITLAFTVLALTIANACRPALAQEPTRNPPRQPAARPALPSEDLSPVKLPPRIALPSVRPTEPAPLTNPVNRAPTKPVPSAEQLAACVRQLDANEFLARETAMLELLDAGPAALPFLKPVLISGGLEATSRALFVLRELAVSGSENAQEQACTLLKELAERRETPALASRASLIIEEITQQRRAIALGELEALGAKITRSQFLGGLALDESVLSIEIGDAFQGQQEDLRRFRWLEDVPVVIFSGPKVTDGWIKESAAVPNLEELHLYQTKVSGTCLLPLAESQTMRQVGIYYTPVGDQVLESLTKMPFLSFIKLYGTQVTKQAADKFKTASGLARLDCRRGAFLGVGCMSGVGQCLISTVHEGSPAEKGGVQREDVIVRFGDTRVVGFDELTEEISRRDVDEEVELELARRTFDDQGNPGRTSIVTKVKLVPWDLDLAVRNGPRP